MPSRLLLRIALLGGLAASVGVPAAAADPKALIDQFEKAQSLFRKNEFAEGRKELQKVVEAARLVPKGDPADDVARQILKFAPDLHANSFHNSAVASQREARAALDRAEPTAIVASLAQAATDLTELAALKPNDERTADWRAEVGRELAQARIVEAVSLGKAVADGLAKQAGIAEAAPLHESAPDFLLPLQGEAGVVRSSDFDGRTVVVQVGSVAAPGAALAFDLLGPLMRRYDDKALQPIFVSMDEGKALAELTPFFEKHPAKWPVALDDRAEFARSYLQGGYSIPTYVVVTRDRRAFRFSGRLPLESTAAVAAFLDVETAREPAKLPRGPDPFFAAAEPIGAAHVVVGPRPKEGSASTIRFGARPGLLLVLNDGGSAAGPLDDLAAVAAAHGEKLQLAVAMYGDDGDAVRKLAANRPFPVHRLQVHPPACYGENYVPRLIPILPGGRVLKDLALDQDAEHRRAILAKYAAVVMNPAFARSDAGSRTDLAARAVGGRVVRVSSNATPGSERFLIDGAVDERAWKSAPGLPQEIVLSFLEEKPATFDRLRVQPKSDLADFEVLASDDPAGPFRSLGRFRLQRSAAVQAFSLPRTTARFVMLRLSSAYDVKDATPSASLGEIAIDEAADVQPAVSDRVAATFRARPGFQDDFESGRAEFWEQRDLPGAQQVGAWDVERGRLRQSQSADDREPRGTALLHAHPPVQDFALQAVIEGTTQVSGVVFAFRDWDDFDRLAFVKGNVSVAGSSDGNCIRLERWRNAQVETLGVHGEAFPTNEPIAVEIVRSGRRIAVKLRDRVILHRDDVEPRTGRVGFHAAGRGDFDVHEIRFAPLSATDPAASWPTPDLPSTAAGSSIAWLNSQGDARDPRTWASNLLRQPVFSPPGVWEARRVDDEPPEIAFAFRDGGEETLTGIRFALPAASGADARNLTRRIEVLASRDPALRPERFVSLGRFELAPRVELQSFAFPQPVVCRFLTLRLIENFGGDRFRLARVAFDRAPSATIRPADVAAGGDRTRIEREFAQPAELSEREPNDLPAQANPLPDGKTVEALVRFGEVDAFRLPDPPAKRGLRTLHLRLDALPWLRLNALVTDEAGQPLGPPLARLQAGQSVENSWRLTSPENVPRGVRIDMPPASIGLVVDTSGSMGGREEDVRAALGGYLGGAAADERVQVFRFGTNVVPLGRLPQDRTKVTQAIAGLRFDGNTALFEALLAAVPENQAIVLLSDGMNTVPKVEFTDLSRALRKRPVPLYAIGVGWDLYEYDARSGNVAIDLLRNLTRQTGGRFFFAPESEQLADLYREIADEIRGGTRYRLTARWETFERQVELARSDGPRFAAVPKFGDLPPPEVELIASRPPGESSGPVSFGLPPAATEPSPIAAGPSPPVAIAALPSGSEPELASRPPTAAFGAFATPLPSEPELAGATRVAPIGPLQSNLPEFGGLVVSHVSSRPQAPPLPPSLMPIFELILDSSHSMAEKLGDKPKLATAQEVTRSLVDALPDGSQVGLRLYGHWGVWVRRRTDPAAPAVATDDPRLDVDSQLVVGIGPLDADRRKQLRTWIDWAQPRGKTPLVFSLLEATRDFPAERVGAKSVILISDGVETCGGKLEDVAAAYRDAEIGVVVHVVGFDIRETDAERQLRRIAEYGGGNYYRAGDATELARALRSAVGSVNFLVHAADGKTVVARGLVNGEPVDLAPGDYRVGFPGGRDEPLAVRIDDGRTLRLNLTETGRLLDAVRGEP